MNASYEVVSVAHQMLILDMATQPDPQWSELDDVSAALGAIANCQAAIRNADVKAAVLLGIQLELVALMASVWRTAEVPDRPYTPGAAAVFLACVVIASLRFGAALWPRTSGPPAGNRFGLDAVVASPGMNGAEVRLEAWQLAAVLAQTATSKYHQVRAGIPWLGVAALSMVILMSSIA